jgi:hypothetical protein
MPPDTNSGGGTIIVSLEPQQPSAPANGIGERRTLAATCAAHFVHDGIADALYVLLPIWA